jgi:hypothetical protein
LQKQLDRTAEAVPVGANGVAVRTRPHGGRMREMRSRKVGLNFVGRPA